MKSSYLSHQFSIEGRAVSPCTSPSTSSWWEVAGRGHLRNWYASWVWQLSDQILADSCIAAPDTCTPLLLHWLAATNLSSLTALTLHLQHKLIPFLDQLHKALSKLDKSRG